MPKQVIAFPFFVLQLQVPKSLVGFVIGRRGKRIMNIQDTCGVRLQFQNGRLCYLERSLLVSWLLLLYTDLSPLCAFNTDNPWATLRLVTISGPPNACHRAKIMVEDMIAEVL